MEDNNVISKEDKHIIKLKEDKIDLIKNIYKSSSTNYKNVLNLLNILIDIEKESLEKVSVENLKSKQYLIKYLRNLITDIENC